MSEARHSVRYPGESDAYRVARNQLLDAEAELRRRLEEVAALRRDLPLGGRVREDYIFEEATPDGSRPVRLSELFAPHRGALVAYSFMFGPAMAQPCPMCSCFLDGANAYAPHLEQRINFVVIAKSPPERLAAWAHTRGWNRLRLLSSANNRYNADYAAETPEGQQIPACNVFTQGDDGIHHFWAAELLYVPTSGHSRHVDLLWPLWSYFDLTPEGRGTDWLPKLTYG